MDPQQLHLWINHFPVVGCIWMLPLMLFALWRPSKNLNHATLTLVVLVGLSALSAHRTGHPAEEVLTNHPDVSIADVSRHERASTRALAAALVTAALGLIGVAINARKPGARLALWPAAAALVLTVALMVQTAYWGGRIRRPELRSQTSEAGHRVIPLLHGQAAFQGHHCVSREG